MDQGGWGSLRQLGVRQYGIVSRAQAEERGVTRAELRTRVSRGDLELVYPRVYRFAGNRITWEQRALAATLLYGSSSALSHSSAGVLFRLDGFMPSPHAPLELTVPRSTRPRRENGLTLHRSRTAPEATHRRGLRVTTLARTLVDLAATLPEDRLEFALDSAQRLSESCADELRALLDALPRRTPGAGPLRDLVAARAGLVTDSPLEARAARQLRLAGVPRPQSRVKVFDDRGYVMRLDLCWPEHRVALHVDSYQWHQQRERFERDATQRARLAALGWVSVPITSRGLEDGSWLADLRRTLGLTAPQLALDLGAVTAAR
jgi:hypothetical protein